MRAPHLRAARGWSGVLLACSILAASTAHAANLATPTATAIAATPAATPVLGSGTDVTSARGSCLFDPPSLATDTFTVIDCAAPGAGRNDLVSASLESYAVTGYDALVIQQAFVTRENVVRFVLANVSATTRDLGPLTVRYRVSR